MFSSIYRVIVTGTAALRDSVVILSSSFAVCINHFNIFILCNCVASFLYNCVLLITYKSDNISAEPTNVKFVFHPYNPYKAW